jgi:hypothetical protein
MRSYANDTALPGGKYEPGDEDEEGTAVGPVGVAYTHRIDGSRSVARLTKRYLVNRKHRTLTDLPDWSAYQPGESQEIMSSRSIPYRQ